LETHSGVSAAAAAAVATTATSTTGLAAASCTRQTAQQLAADMKLISQQSDESTEQSKTVLKIWLRPDLVNLTSLISVSFLFFF
jgi:hypothetical protein